MSALERPASSKGAAGSYLLAFSSTHAALSAHFALAEYKPHIIPTPRDITAGCGMSLTFFAQGEGCARKILDKAGLNKKEYSLYLFDSGALQLLAH
jgi:Protein of unknown function (DUF3343)